MAFDLTIWKEKLAARLPGWKSRMKQAGVNSTYAFISAATLWPVVEAVRQGEWAAAPAALGGVLAGLGSNLLANQIQGWKDEADAARHLEKAASEDAPLRAELDAVLDKLEALPLAEQSLSEADRAWFTRTMQEELARLGSGVTYQATVTGTGAVAQGDGATAVGAGGMYIGGSVKGGVVSGDKIAGDKVLGDMLINSIKIVFTGEDKQARAKELLARYLRLVINECAPLRLAAIDQSAGRPGQSPLGLAHVYVDLNLDFRLPERQKLAQFLAARPQEKAGMERPEPKEERLAAALEALACHPALVLLGTPGSGKSTFSSYLALSLAEAGLGEKAALKRLGEDWSYGPLLPVRVVLRKFSESLPADLALGRAGDLWRFIEDELTKCGLPKDVSPVIRDMAQESGALFLLDGLDEAGDAGRRTRVLEAVSEFIRNAGPGCRFLLTARPYAWEDLQSPPAEMPVRYSLARFDDEQMQTFIERWYQAVHALGWVSASDVTEKTASLQTAVRRADLRPLAENPLLLTLMATLHTNRGRLPDDRADLYDEVVKLLLERWNTVSGAERSLLDALAMPGLKLDNLRDVVEQVAYEAHSRHVGKSGTADLSETDLLNAFRPLLGGSLDNAALVVTYIENRAGLLLGQGPRDCVRQFTFPHRTFQEYLAGCYLARQVDFNERAASLAQAAPDHWREALVLAARRAGRERGVSVADRLLHHQDVEAYQRKSGVVSEADWRAGVLAGEQLLELGLATLDSHEAARVVRERAAGWLARLLESGALPVPERVQAGDTLAKLGDPRPEVMTCEGMAFCHVPGGEFLFGEKKQKVGLDEFWIGQYPVTNAQFGQFVAAGSYQNPVYWQEAQKAGYWSKDGFKGRWDKAPRQSPVNYGEPFTLPNHPVVGVSWYETLAFTRWLSERISALLESWNVNGDKTTFQEKLKSGLWQVTLPGEKQWEKAARGTDGREYPWGQEFDANKANTSETGIGSTSAVGCFPGGQSPYGLLDASGNVWEWMSEGDDALRVLRGGSFSVMLRAPAALPVSGASLATGATSGVSGWLSPVLLTTLTADASGLCISDSLVLWRGVRGEASPRRLSA